MNALINGWPFLLAASWAPNTVKNHRSKFLLENAYIIGICHSVSKKLRWLRFGWEGLLEGSLLWLVVNMKS